MKGVSPVELIHGGTDPAGHGDHIHVAYAKGGETLEYHSPCYAWRRRKRNCY